MNREEEFSESLVWNEDKTACFIASEFSDATIVEISDRNCKCFRIEVSLKNGGHYHYFIACSDEKTAKTDLMNLMREIARKVAIPDHRMV